jgi:hypothetical protein
MPELTLAAVMAIVGTVATVGGTAIQGVGRLKAGRAEKDAAFFEADQAEALSKEELAAGQREGFEIDRQGNLLKSRQTAVAAASGLGAGDISVLDATADVDRLVKYRKDLALFSAIQRAKGLRAQATAARKSGRASLTGGRFGAAGSVAGGVGAALSSSASFFSNYAGSILPGATPETPPLSILNP